MARTEIVAIKVMHCPRIQEEAALLERRRYLTEVDAAGEPAFVIEATYCSHDIACNMNDHIQCRWSFKGGDDPFTEVKPLESET